MSTSKRRVPSRLLKSLFEEASSTRNRVTWARAVCRAAAHQARSGEVDEALTSIAAVRKEFGVELLPEVGCWLMLAEGILHWYRFEPRPAHERLIRAHALSAAMKTPRISASCAAWLALIEFNSRQYESMVRHLDEAFVTAAPNDHQARARATLVLADAYQFAGDFPTAQPWYEQSRRHITSEGDEAALGAMLFNIATFRLSNLRLSDAFGDRSESEIRRASMEASGSVSFDYMTGNSSQEELRHLLRGQQFVLEQKYGEALQIFMNLDMQAIDYGQIQPLVSVDLAWCHLNLGNMDSATTSSVVAEQQLQQISDSDDRAYVLARLARICSSVGNQSRADRLQYEADLALEKHRQFQTRLHTMLSAIRAVPMK